MVIQLFVAFCNGRYFGGGFEIGKDANVQDGFIDLNFVSTLPKRLILYYIFLMLKKRLDLGKLYFHDKLKSVDLITRQTAVRAHGACGAYGSLSASVVRRTAAEGGNCACSCLKTGYSLF